MLAKADEAKAERDKELEEKFKDINDPKKQMQVFRTKLWQYNHPKVFVVFGFFFAVIFGLIQPLCGTFFVQISFRHRWEIMISIEISGFLFLTRRFFTRKFNETAFFDFGFKPMQHFNTWFDFQSRFSNHNSNFISISVILFAFCLVIILNRC